MNFQTEFLIEKVRSFKCLWDITCKDYTNKKKKSQVWNKISEECGISVEKCKSKWKNLRNSYCREIRRCQDATASEPAWKYFKGMEFLADSIKPRDCSYITNFKSDNLEPSASTSQRSTLTLQPSTSTLQNLLCTMESIKNTVHQSMSISNPFAELNEDDLFLQSMLIKMKKFPTKEKNEAKIHILQYLCEIENRLSENSEYYME